MRKEDLKSDIKFQGKKLEKGKKRTANMESSMEIHQKIKNRITIKSSNPSSGYPPQKSEKSYL